MHVGSDTTSEPLNYVGKALMMTVATFSRFEVVRPGAKGTGAECAVQMMTACRNNV
jgi:hypothetical protein